MKVYTRVHLPDCLKRLSELALLACLIFMGLTLRFDDIYRWHQEPDKFFINNVPALTTNDGYYYLRLARDISDNNYDPIDRIRSVPDYTFRPSPPPLLSSLTSLLSCATSISLNWIAVTLPAFLAVLLAVPLYAVGKHFGGPAMALSAVAMGLSSYAYLSRTSLGRFDTDCMNVVFAMFIATCFLKFATIKQNTKYIYFCLGIALYLLFLAWWDQSPVVVTGISLTPLLMALLFFYRPKKLAWLAILIALTVLFFLLIIEKDFLSGISQSVQQLYTYISKDQNSLFPQIGVAITEQQKLSFSDIVKFSTNSTFVFSIATIGFIILFIYQFKTLSFFLVPILLGSFTFFFANRFFIFLVPVVAIGFGYAIEKIWMLTKNRRGLVVTAPLLFIYMIWQNVTLSQNIIQFSPFSMKSIAGLAETQNKTTGESIIWSSCDNGYIISYWADRSSMCDGQNHGGERSVYNALPLASDNFRFSANYMNFFATHGEEGVRKVYKILGNDHGAGLLFIKELFAAGPKNAKNIIKASVFTKAASSEHDLSGWIDFFFPVSQTPVYLFIDWRMILESPWLYWYGTWDVDKHDGIKPLPSAFFFNSRIDKTQVIDPVSLMSTNLNRGSVNLQNNDVPIASARISGKKTSATYSFPSNDATIIDTTRYKTAEKNIGKKVFRTGNYHFEFNEENNLAMLLDQNVSRSVYFQLFWSSKSPTSKYFQPIIINTPHYQLWKIVPDVR